MGQSAGGSQEAGVGAPCPGGHRRRSEEEASGWDVRGREGSPGGDSAVGVGFKLRTRGEGGEGGRGGRGTCGKDRGCAGGREEQAAVVSRRVFEVTPRF